jgi:hypothetical protein
MIPRREKQVFYALATYSPLVMTILTVMMCGVLIGCAAGGFNAMTTGVMDNKTYYSLYDPGIIIKINDAFNYENFGEAGKFEHSFQYEDKLIYIHYYHKLGSGEKTQAIHEPIDKKFWGRIFEKDTVKKERLNLGGVDFECIIYVQNNGDSYSLAKEMVYESIDHDNLLIRFIKVIPSEDALLLLDKTVHNPKSENIIKRFESELKGDITFSKADPSEIESLKNSLAKGIPPKKEVAPPAAQTAYINYTINSEPSSAQVYLNGELKGTTPAVITIKEGEYQVEARKEGFQSETKNLHITKNTPATNFALVSLPMIKPIQEPEAFRVFLDVIPTDAVINIKNTTAEFHQGIMLKSGDYNFTIEKKGYDTINDKIHITNKDFHASYRLKEQAQIKSGPDLTPPAVIVMDQARDPFNSSSIRISGKASDDSGIEGIYVNGVKATLNPDGLFRADILLKPNSNTVKIEAVDTSKNKAVKFLTVN